MNRWQECASCSFGRACTKNPNHTGCYHQVIEPKPTLAATVERAKAIAANSQQDAIDWLTVQYYEAMEDERLRLRHDRAISRPAGEPLADLLKIATSAARSVVHAFGHCTQPQTRCDNCRPRDCRRHGVEGAIGEQ